ncbi:MULTISPECIES: hypothetical protein [Halomicrobium]|uniref:Uncharacterized protein n=2 Tax=Halomicrobium mukohataei TaxID=57705 RepID=C7NZQ5_HALMD|nr:MULTISPECIES: hypothetical protein [Halomicrobium]ACV48823.1 hypothetical protein Hmuk_2717 [Halomicrobium mukohataei DSM 12286]QCD64255.1 hypothetical protein E5139_00890 [Halomicrobium mukohataei]QFR19061.1 hypothetical protein GBQ70_00890 [Halomicrobium sp. ZPS1]
MCFAALLNGDATDRSVVEMIRDELPRSLGNGTVAAVLVVAVSVLEGASLALTAGMAFGAIALGTVLHQAVLLGGVALLRGREGLRGRSSTRA